MSYNISKELVEAVVGEEYDNVVCFQDVILCYKDDYTQRFLVNDFFFKCKEWATKQNICVLSGIDDDFTTYFCFIDNNSTIQSQFNSSSEQQAVFDACQWILENK